MGKIAERYFKNLFSSDEIGVRLEDLVTIRPIVSQDQNVQLMKPVTIEEIRSTVFDINLGKCPRPDQMTGHFYQQNWESVNGSVIEMMHKFIDHGKLEANINKTSICLVPKVHKAKKMTEFRTISLSNVAYKIVAKILAKRLKKIMPFII